MEKAKIEVKSTGLLKIELNNKGDYIVVSADNPIFFDNFATGFKRITDLADEVPAKLDEIENKYSGKDDFNSKMDKTLEMSNVNVKFSKDAVDVIDGIFGEGTVNKYFRNIIEEIPDFLPDVDCILDFFEKITPEIEKLFDRKIEYQKKKSKERMAKYQPQDHRKPGSK